jgi:hypothetical protein
MHPTSLEHRVNAGTARDLAVLQAPLLDLGCKPGICSAVLGGLPVLPGGRATLGNLQGLAEHGEGVLVAVLGHAVKFHRWPRAKMASASDRISPNLLIFG